MLDTEVVTTTPDTGAETTATDTTTKIDPAVTTATAGNGGKPPVDTTAKTTTADADDMIGDGDDDSADVAASWPDDWREKMANGDAKLAKRLERFADPTKVTQSWLAAEQKISSGELKKVLPENPTPEQLKEYRAANGIPETPDAYKIDGVLEGVEWGDEDKAALGKFTAALHGVNAPQPVVDALLKTYAEAAQEAAAMRAEQDKAWKQTNEDQLRAELGPEFRSQIGLYKRVLDDPEVFPDGLGSVLGNARDGAGNRLLNDARVAKFLINMGLERYGEGSITIGNTGKTAATRETELVNLMRSNFSEYVRSGGDKELAAIRAKYSGNRD
jgi:hypothetical protein